jgi:hypothetical protein
MCNFYFGVRELAPAASWLIPKNNKRRYKMEQKVDNKKKIVKIVIWVVVILALMATTHIIVNNVDGLEVIRQLHGG